MNYMNFAKLLNFWFLEWIYLFLRISEKFNVHRDEWLKWIYWMHVYMCHEVDSSRSYIGHNVG